MTKLVTFDATNTIIRLSRPLGEQYSLAAKKFGLSLTAAPQVLHNHFKSVMKASQPNYGRSLGMTAKEWWKRVVHETFARAGCPDAQRVDVVFEHLYEEYSKSHMWRVFPEVPDLLQRLCEKKTTLGVVSNFDDRLEQLLVSLQLRRYFAFVLTGYETGFEKPSLDMFRMALREANCDAGDALHVGDSFSHDYCPAMSLGIKALLIDREKGKTVMDAGIPDGDIIESLDSVLDHAS